MAIARSKVSAQGQISVPLDERPKLGVGLGTFTAEDIHRDIFCGRKPKKRTVQEMDEGIAEYIRDRYARD
jgi:hypothetical protein